MKAYQPPAFTPLMGVSVEPNWKVDELLGLFGFCRRLSTAPLTVPIQAKIIVNRVVRFIMTPRIEYIIQRMSQNQFRPFRKSRRICNDDACYQALYHAEG